MEFNSLLSKSAQQRIANGESPADAVKPQTVAQPVAQPVSQTRKTQAERDAEIVAALMARIARGEPAPEQSKTINPFVGLTDEEVERLQR